MRTEQEVMDTILGAAKADERVRAVYMTGSRCNPAVKKDSYQDYDVVYVVTDTHPFLADTYWLCIFGELAMKQEPDSLAFGWGKNSNASCSYTWLMLFQDGNRIDLTIKTAACALADYRADTLCRALLDKDHLLPEKPAPNDSGYWIHPPTRQEFDGCCNEFWWCLNNVAKGIARGQVPYALKMYQQTVHIELEKMLEWFIGAEHNFSVSTGMWGKYYQQYLPQDIYKRYTKTYASCGGQSLWRAVFVACGLFHRLATAVAKHSTYLYPVQEEENMRQYLRRVRRYSGQQ